MTLKSLREKVDNQRLRFLIFFRKLDRNVKVTIAGISLHSWSERLSMQYNSIYIMNLGASYANLGLLNSIGAAVSSISLVVLGWIAEKRGLKKVLLFGLASAIIVALLYAVAENWLMLIPALIIYGTVRCTSFADIIITNYTSLEQRASILGFARVLYGILRVFAPMTAAVIVVNFGGLNIQGIRPLYYIQLFLAIVAFILIAVMLKIPPVTPTKDKGELSPKGAGFIQDFRELFEGERWLKRWMMVRMFRQFSIRLSTPFLILWMVEIKGATPYILGSVGTATTIMALLLTVPLGRLADKIGRKRTIYLLEPAKFLSVFLLIMAPSPVYLILYGIMKGIAEVSTIPFTAMHWEMVPKEKRGRWYGMDGVLLAASIPAAFLGGILWQQGFMVQVLLLPILVEAIVTIPILMTIPDTLIRSK